MANCTSEAKAPFWVRAAPALWALAAWSIPFLCIHFWPALSNACEKHYGNMRAGLFTGAVSTAAFLLAMKSNLLLKLKTEVYDKKAYLDEIRKIRTEFPEVSFFGPLKRLSHLVSTSIFTSLMSAGLQFTLGLSSRPLAAQICISAGLASLVLVAISWAFLWIELSRWLIRCEDTERKNS